MQVEVKRPDGKPSASQFEVDNVVVPAAGRGGRDGDVEQGLDEIKEALQNPCLSEVLLDLLATEGVARFTQFFTRKTAVPGLQNIQAQWAQRIRLQLGCIFFRKGPRARCQVANKLQHLVGVLRHLGHQRQRRVVAVA